MSLKLGQEYQNTQILKRGEEYPSVLVDLKTTNQGEVNCWHTRFVLQYVSKKKVSLLKILMIIL